MKVQLFATSVVLIAVCACRPQRPEKTVPQEETKEEPKENSIENEEQRSDRSTKSSVLGPEKDAFETDPKGVDDPSKQTEFENNSGSSGDTDNSVTSNGIQSGPERFLSDWYGTEDMAPSGLAFATIEAADEQSRVDAPR